VLIARFVEAIALKLIKKQKKVVKIYNFFLKTVEIN
jgi:hypothetical protein